ncbi:MAG TPA: macrolide ABC transporter permease/ATP-binding protein MacB, partial [Paenirhodobacter sp.]
LVGGILGIVTALGAGTLITSLAADTRLVFSPLAIAVAFLSSTLIGITFGFLPARSAAKLDPVVALNRE